MIKLNRSTTNGALGLAVCCVVLLAQTTAPGRELVAALRLSVLGFLQQFDVAAAPLRAPRLLFESKYQLQHELMACELQRRTDDAQLANSKSIEKENADLKASLGVVSDSKNWIPATVLTAEEKYYLDRGTKANVTKDSIVIADGSFFGVVTEAGSGISELETVFDQEMRLGVKVLPKGIDGVLTRTASQILLTTISRTEDISAGDIIVTLGEPKVKRAGILVGRIDRILTRPADPVSTFIVKLALERGQVQTVLVTKE